MFVPVTCVLLLPFLFHRFCFSMCLFSVYVSRFCFPLVISSWLSLVSACLSHPGVSNFLKPACAFKSLVRLLCVCNGLPYVPWFYYWAISFLTFQVLLDFWVLFLGNLDFSSVIVYWVKLKTNSNTDFLPQLSLFGLTACSSLLKLKRKHQFLFISCK